MGSATVQQQLSSALGETVRVAKTMQFGNAELSNGDVVLIDNSISAGLVQACLRLEDTHQFALLVQPLVRNTVARAFSTFSAGDGLQVLPLSDVNVRLPHCWAWRGDSELLVLHAIV